MARQKLRLLGIRHVGGGALLRGVEGVPKKKERIFTWPNTVQYLDRSKLDFDAPLFQGKIDDRKEGQARRGERLLELSNVPAGRENKSRNRHTCLSVRGTTNGRKPPLGLSIRLGMVGRERGNNL